MSNWMNAYDIEEALNRFAAADCTNLAAATFTLVRLHNWTNDNSDGWPYWQKPAKAADRLMGLIQSADRFDPTDATEAEVKATYTPIKRFLTAQGVPHEDIIVTPEVFA